MSRAFSVSNLIYAPSVLFSFSQDNAHKKVENFHYIKQKRLVLVNGLNIEPKLHLAGNFHPPSVTVFTFKYFKLTSMAAGFCTQANALLRKNLTFQVGLFLSLQ